MAKTTKKRTQSKPQKEKRELTREEKLALLLRDINGALKAEGKVYLGKDHKPPKRFLTGILGFDAILGGGLPLSHLVELFGTESSGKTLLAMLSAAEIQRKGGTVAWVKGEGFDAPWADKNGVDVDKLIICEAATGDTALESMLTLLESGLINGLVLDSFQSLGTTREMTSSVESEAYGNAGAPQMWGRIMRRAYSAANRGFLDDTAIIGVSQVRSKMGAFSKSLAAIDGVPSQIHAILHWKGVSIRCRRGEKFYSKPEGKGFIHSKQFQLRCEKNKTAGTEGMSTDYIFQFRPFKGVPFGVDNVVSLFDLGKEFGLIEVAGSWYSGYGIRVQGGDSFIEALRDDEDAREEMYGAVIRAMRGDTDET